MTKQKQSKTEKKADAGLGTLGDLQVLSKEAHERSKSQRWDEGDTGEIMRAGAKWLNWIIKKVAPTQKEKTEELKQRVAKLKAQLDSQNEYEQLRQAEKLLKEQVEQNKKKLKAKLEGEREAESYG